MAQSITSYVRWAFTQLGEQLDEQKMLTFLNDVSPCHIDDLKRVISPQASILRVLSRLIDLGLVEREADDLYRLTPLLSRRLSRDLWRPDLLKWVAQAKRDFVTSPVNSTPTAGGDHEFLRLEARIQSALYLPSEDIPPSLAVFVSASHWFQAGIRLYHAHKVSDAYRLLKKAQLARDHFRDASRQEIDRYFCLSATRMRVWAEAEACIKRLSSDSRSKAIATFLQADLYEYRRMFPEAIRGYEEALLQDRDKPKRQEFIFRPLIRCILASRWPDYKKAEQLALKYVGLKRTVFSLSSLARVYLLWKYKGSHQQSDVPRNIDFLYKEALRELVEDPGSGAAPFELYAEEAEFTGDFAAALDNMGLAIQMDPSRFQLRAERWRMMSKSGDQQVAMLTVREMSAAKSDVSFASVWPSYIHALAETFVRALLASDQQAQLVNAFAPELQKNGELGQIISFVKRSV